MQVMAWYGMRKWLGLLMVGAATVSLACDGRTSVRGGVYDSQKKPIGNAEVQLTAVKSQRVATSQSEEDGSFVVGITHGFSAGRFLLTVSRPGYVTYRAEIAGNTRETMDVTLVSEGTTTPVSGGERDSTRSDGAGKSAPR
jgi:hypothetical protein